MRYVKNMILVTLLSLWMVCMIPANLSAAGLDMAEIKADSNNPPIVYSVQKTNVIIKYRVYNGKLQYRRWDMTIGVWLDPYWIDA